MRSALVHLLILGFVLVLLAGCDQQGDSPPAVREVVVVGTIVPSDFVSTGRFVLRVIPLDAEGRAILSDDVTGTIQVERPANVTATMDLEAVNAPSGNPLVVPLDIDASGSMIENDPTNARLAGARSFVDVLELSGQPYESAIFEFSGESGRELQGLTSNNALLKAAINRIGANSGTPTYRSLDQILDLLEAERSGGSFERAIVLLSDGMADDAAQRPALCNYASSVGVPIYAIGLGPASDLAENDEGAVAEMRAIAACTGGVYIGISPSNIDSSTVAIFNNFGLATLQGSISFNVDLDGPGVGQLLTGERVEGRLRLQSGGEEAVAVFAFTTP